MERVADGLVSEKCRDSYEGGQASLIQEEGKDAPPLRASRHRESEKVTKASIQLNQSPRSYGDFHMNKCKKLKSVKKIIRFIY